jgi:hypothetical protein
MPGAGREPLTGSLRVKVREAQCNGATERAAEALARRIVC